MSQTTTLTLAEIEEIALKALVKAGTSQKNASSLAKATAATEADGVASHGLAYIPTYCDHVRCGKVDGMAVPVVNLAAPSVIQVDAATGFAHPAIELGFEHLIAKAKTQGITMLAIKNSYNCGVLGYHTLQLAKSGFLGIGFTNAPASISPSGGSKAIVGTNPFSIAVPNNNGDPEILIDQSASTIAKSEVMKHARENKPIPEGWALDPEGNPTTDPNIGLKGTMAPAGGYKGVGIALLTEIMAGALTGATMGINASPFSGTAGGPPKTGQLFIAIDVNPVSGGLFGENISALVAAARQQDGARLPGDGRRSKRIRAIENGVEVSKLTLDKIATKMAE